MVNACIQRHLPFDVEPGYHAPAKQFPEAVKPNWQPPEDIRKPSADYLSRPTRRQEGARRDAKREGQVMITTSSMRNGRLLAATAFAFGLLTTSSFAYTPEQQQMCSGDAMRLCGEYIPNVERITACMIEKYSSLSDGCKAVFDAPPQPAATTATTATTVPSTKPASYPQATKPASHTQTKPVTYTQ